MADEVKGSRLLPDGSYERLRPRPGEASRRSQDVLDPARHERAAQRPARLVDDGRGPRTQGE